MLANVVERRAADPEALLTICDFSPPRGADPSLLEPAQQVGADFFSVAYHPGKSTTANSAFTAFALRQQTGRDVVFTLATRDMNQLALQSLLLGASLVGLENVVIVKGDPFTERERERASIGAVDEVTPSRFITAINEMNEGRDFRGRELAAPPHLCVGATIDLGAGAGREPALTRRKVEAGARFFLVQALFSPDPLFELMERYEREYGEPLTAPLFCGLQVLTSEGIVFGDVPDAYQEQLERGRPGEEIALEVGEQFLARGLRSLYLVPPILRGGARDYAAAARVLEQLPSRIA